MVTPGASSSQDTFARAATPEPEAAPSGGASAVPTWKAEPSWVRLEHLLDSITEEKTVARGDLRTTFWGPYHWVTDLGDAFWYMEQLWFDLMGSCYRPILGIDVKCYYGEVCIVQLSSWRRGVLLDALELKHYVGDLLQPLLSDEQICKVFHGHFNVSWLYSSFNVEVSPPIFDTFANAQELDSTWEDGWQPSLQMMCRRYLNYELDDTFQMANWRQRPMPEEMLQYAAIEVQVLLPLESAIEIIY